MSWAGRSITSGLGRPHAGVANLELVAGFKKNVNRATTQVMMKAGECGLGPRNNDDDDAAGIKNETILIDG